MAHYRETTAYVRLLGELVRAAEYRGLTTYHDLAAIMGLTLMGELIENEISPILAEIVEEEVKAARPMLSAVVVGASGRPGAGFFEQARKLGRLAPGQDEAEFWGAEREAVYEAWRRPLPKPIAE
jgi:hypothetical protein